MNRDTLKAIYRASKATSTDESRYHLHWVRLIPVDGKFIRITATNGHVMTDVKVEDESLFNLLEGKPGFVPPESFPVMKALLAQNDMQAIGSWPVQDDKDACIRVGESGVSFTIYRTPGGGEYPDVDKVIPKDREGTVRIGIDVNYLMRVARLAKNDYDGHNRVEIEFDPKKPLEQIVIRDLNRKQLGVLMPVRVS